MNEKASKQGEREHAHLAAVRAPAHCHSDIRKETMTPTTDDERAALADGASALRFRAMRLLHHPLYDDHKPDSERLVQKFLEHARILESMTLFAD